jgi:DNA-binding Lrp family transcriptional regulator
MAYETALAALSDPTRRLVFERILAAPRPVTAIAEGLPVSRPAVLTRSVNYPFRHRQSCCG